MGKKKSKSQKLAALAWCWYCDRTFEDQRVLLSHQKAKHFRCSMCPRRLNTAGGLAVHLDQVHKVGTDKIENALPGRESFDVEIYGMEGVPAADLAAWKKRQAEEAGIPTDEQRPKKARFAQVALTPAEAKAQLAAHRILMGLVPAPVDAAVAIPLAAPPAPVPVPGMPPVPAPPPGFMPPPGFAPPGMPFPPPPGAMPFPLVPGMPPPPGFPMPPAGLAFPPPGMLPPPGFVPPPGMPLAPPAAPVPAAAPQSVRQKVPSSSVTLKPGTLLVYGDNDVSPEEKRARLSQYSLANEPRLAAAPSTAGPASATGPADASAVGSYASVATEGAPASVVTGEAKGIDHNGGGDPQTAEIETGGAAAAAVAAGGKKRARAADLMG